MAITPSQWQRRVEITAQGTHPTLSGFNAVITQANLPAEIWSIALNGGGDLRLCLNSDGTGQLPLEVVSFDTSAQTAVLWTRFPSFATGTSCWLFYGKAGETQPPVTDTYGRNAVWVDYALVDHGGSQIDSSGNCTSSSVGTIGTSDGVFGTPNGAYSNLSSTSYVEYLGGPDIGSSATFQSSVKLSVVASGSQGSMRLVSANRTGTTTNDYNLSELDFSSGNSRDLSTFEFTNTPNVWFWRLGRNGGAPNELKSISDAILIGGGLAAASAPSGIGRYRVGASADDTPFGASIENVCEIRIRNSALTDDWITTEYANQSSPATFFAAGTPENTMGGGGGVTANGDFTLPAITLSGTASASLPQPIATGDFTLPSLTLSGVASATLPQPQINGSFTMPALSISGVVHVTQPNFSIVGNFTMPALTMTGEASATQPQPSINGNFTLPAISVSGQASATLPNPIANGSFTLPALTLNGSASVTEPVFIANGDFTLPNLTLSGQASATLPQPIANGSFTLPAIQIGGVAIVGGVAIISTDGNTIFEPNLSNVIYEPTRSNTLRV